MADFTCFWKPNEKNGFLCQWYYAKFKDNNDSYSNTEQYMMAHKALLFNDKQIWIKIMNAKHPREMKSLGRRIRNFDEKIWNENKEQIVYNGNLLKFSQNPKLLKQLLDTGDKLLVEASPYDRIWGIGFDERNAFNRDGSPVPNWGENLLGKCLMNVRKKLKHSSKIEK